MTSDFYENENMTGREKEISSRQAFAKLLPYLKEHYKGLMICLFLLAGGTILSLYWPLLLRRALDVDIADGDFRGLLR